MLSSLQLSPFRTPATVPLAAAVLLGLLAPHASPAADPPVAWLTGPELEKRLESPPVGISWQDVPIRDGLLNLSRKQAVCVFIDRRVDPTRRVEVAVAGPLLSVFRAIAEEHNAQHASGDARVGPAQKIAVTRVGPVVYFGPEEIARRLRTVAELRKQAVADLPVSARQPLGRMRAWRWDDGTSPRELIEQLTAEGGVDILGADALPHDLWAAADLPAMSLCDRLSLVAAGFDLTFRIEDDGRRLRLSPIGEEDLVLVREYPAGAKPDDFARQIRDLLPDARVALVGKVVRVSGTAEDHERLEDARRRGRNPAASAGGKQLYSLNAPNVPLRTILEKLGQDQKLEFRVDEKLLEAKGLSLDVRMTINVKDVELDALLKEALSPAGLTFRRTGKVVEVTPAP